MASWTKFNARKALELISKSSLPEISNWAVFTCGPPG